MPYQNTAKKVREYLTQVIPQEGLNFKTINDICNAIVRGIIEEFPGRYINEATGEDCWYTEYIAGEALAKGQNLAIPQSGNSKVIGVCPITGSTQDMPVGVALDTVAQGEVVRVAIKGIALALPDLAITAAKGYVVYAGSTTAGRLAQASEIGAAQHWRESGHWAETGSSNGALTLLHIHHN